MLPKHTVACIVPPNLPFLPTHLAVLSLAVPAFVIECGKMSAFTHWLEYSASLPVYYCASGLVRSFDRSMCI